jgi:hypothetical protein
MDVKYECLRMLDWLWMLDWLFSTHPSRSCLFTGKARSISKRARCTSRVRHCITSKYSFMYLKALQQAVQLTSTEKPPCSRPSYSGTRPPHCSFFPLINSRSSSVLSDSLFRALAWDPLYKKSKYKTNIEADWKARQWQTRKYLRGKYYCTVDLLFDWFGISCTATDNSCFYLQNRLIQTSQTGGQQYSDTSHFSIPWTNALSATLLLSEDENVYNVARSFAPERVSSTQSYRRLATSP